MAALKQGFLKAHYDWMLAGLGLCVLVGAGVFVVAAFGVSSESAAESCELQLKAVRPTHEGVLAADLTVLKGCYRLAKTPPSLTEVDPKKSNFLASEQRVLCQNGDPDNKSKKACGKPIPAGLEVCPFCGVKQNVVKVEADTDHDGLPNEWEIKYGLNPNDPADASADPDGDGFTNAEEYAAKTDPKDKNSHPDYLDYLAVAGELKQTFLPFFFTVANPIPDGKGGRTYRLSFQRLNAKSLYDSKFSVKVGEPIKSADGKIDTGYVAKTYTPKTVERIISGSKTKAKKMVDVSTVELVRTSDDKKILVTIGERKVPVETQVDLNFNRPGGKTMTVSVGSEIVLHDQKYRILKLQKGANGCEVIVEHLSTKKQKVIR